MGTIAPTAKNVVGAMPSSCPNGNFVNFISIKRASILTKGALISARICTKIWEAYSAPQNPYLYSRGTDKDKRRERGKTWKEDRGGRGRGKRGRTIGKKGGNGGGGERRDKEGRQRGDGKSRPHGHF